MGIEKGQYSRNRAVFVDYAFESVMFRCDPTTNHVYRKFYGQHEELKPIPDSNHLFNEALRFGDEISAAQYAAGKPAK